MDAITTRVRQTIDREMANFRFQQWVGQDQGSHQQKTHTRIASAVSSCTTAVFDSRKSRTLMTTLKIEAFGCASNNNRVVNRDRRGLSGAHDGLAEVDWPTGVRDVLPNPVPGQSLTSGTLTP